MFGVALKGENLFQLLHLGVAGLVQKVDVFLFIISIYIYISLFYKRPPVKGAQSMGNQ